MTLVCAFDAFISLTNELRYPASLLTAAVRRIRSSPSIPQPSRVSTAAGRSGRGNGGDPVLASRSAVGVRVAVGVSAAARLTHVPLHGLVCGGFPHGLRCGDGDRQQRRRGLYPGRGVRAAFGADVVRRCWFERGVPGALVQLGQSRRDDAGLCRVGDQGESECGVVGAGGVHRPWRVVGAGPGDGAAFRGLRACVVAVGRDGTNIGA